MTIESLLHRTCRPPEPTSYAWDISHAFITTYHPYCHSPSALTEYLKQKLWHQQAKCLSHSPPAQVKQNIPLEHNSWCANLSDHGPQDSGHWQNNKISVCGIYGQDWWELYSVLHLCLEKYCWVPLQSIAGVCLAENVQCNSTLVGWYLRVWASQVLRSLQPHAWLRQCVMWQETWDLANGSILDAKVLDCCRHLVD